MNLEAKYTQHQSLTQRNYNLIIKFIEENKDPNKVIDWKGTVGFRIIESNMFSNMKDNMNYNNKIKKDYLNTLYLTYDEWQKKISNILNKQVDFEKLEKWVLTPPDQSISDTIVEAATLKMDIELQSMYDHAPIVMMMVNNARRAVRVNKTLLKKLQYDTKDQVIGQRGGDIFRCVHHADVKEGCGYGPECLSCDVKNVVLQSFEDDIPRKRVKTTLTVFDKNNNVIEMNIRFTSIPIKLKNTKYNLIYIEDD